jgi:hypothetical protein
VKTIIYLDQNYVSHLTKARLGVKVNLAAYYENLYDALREAVLDNAVVCPVSQFHYAESELDTRLEPEIYRTLEELYRGVEFRWLSSIIRTQVSAALHDYVAMPPPRRPRWRDAFNRNPDRCRAADADPIRHAISSSAVAFVRRLKALHERLREAEPAPALEVQKRFEAQQFIFDSYVAPIAPLLLGTVDLPAVSRLRQLTDLHELHVKLLGRGPSAEEVVAFLRSSEMLSVPFIDIYSSLRAGMVVWGEGRRLKGSDLNDVLIAATVLPYCDVFATDGHMKQLILALKLDKRYDVTVFGSRKADVLQLTSLVRDL